MDFRSHMSAIEEQARAARIPIRNFCREAGIAVSNWGRWKRGTSPTFSKWAKVEAAATRLFSSVSASTSPSSENTSVHAAGSSAHPIPETAGLPAIAPAHADAHKHDAEVVQ